MINENIRWELAQLYSLKRTAIANGRDISYEDQNRMAELRKLLNEATLPEPVVVNKLEGVIRQVKKPAPIDEFGATTGAGDEIPF